MDDNQRIEAMFESGRITREQADQLLAALAESDSAEHEVDSLDSSGFGSGWQDPGPVADRAVPGPDFNRPASAAAGAQAASGTTSDAQGRLDPDFKWLEIDTFAGNLEISVVDGLSQPEVDEGNVTMTASGARISPWNQAGDDGPRSFIDRIMENIRHANMEIRLPRDWAVSFDVKAGNIDIDGPVTAVKGHLRAGDLSVSETGNVDVKVAAGEAEIGLRAASGRNRIQVSVGQADVRILPGSSLNIDASVNIGDISARQLSKSSRGLGAQASGQVGSNSNGFVADLTVTVVTGDVSIKVQDHA